jgi:alkylhydroperoxidase family enzyme
MPRVAPAQPPFAPEIQARLERIMPKGVPPLTLFTTLARDGRLFERFMAAGLLDPGHLTLRQREIVIDRITALSGSHYEWGVHIAFFAARAGLSEAEIRALAVGEPSDAVWAADERLLVEACDSLHRGCDIDDGLWGRLAAQFSAEAIMEVLMLAGFYRMVSYLTNALRLDSEPFAADFPTAG